VDGLVPDHTSHGVGILGGELLGGLDAIGALNVLESNGSKGDQ
jgi:hypothetical protein